MKSKTYNLNGIAYQYSLYFKKWEFVAGQHSLLSACHGAETAHKVARIINGAVSRVGFIDNLARVNISRVTA